MKRVVRILLAFCCFLIGVFIPASCKKELNPHTRYEINVEYVPKSKTLAGTAKVVFENYTESVLSVLKFQLYPNAYRKDALYKPVSTAYETAAYYAGESYGEMVISSVYGSKNWEVMGEDENILYVYLERALYPGETVVLDVGFITKLANVNHRTGGDGENGEFGELFPHSLWD